MPADLGMPAYTKADAKEMGADCDNCPLRIAGKFVPSSGPDQAEIAYVGEAPGVQEARLGKPFVGPSGRLMDMVNDRYGIKREELFLTNACLCRPADGTNPPPAAIASCRPRLLHELQARGTRTVVAMGNSAALGVLGATGILKLRVGPGRTSPYSELDGVRVIPTVHPAACLRQSDMFPSLVTDIGKIGVENEPWSEPDIEVIDDPVQAISYCRFLYKRASDLVVDIEVDIEKEGPSFDHPNRYGLLCVGTAYKKKHAVVIGERAANNPNVRRAMAIAFRANRLVAQNGKFDLAGLHPVTGDLQLYFDTLIAHYCLDERPGTHGLKQQMTESLGAPDYEAEIRPYVGQGVGYGNIPRPILYKYCGWDCVGTFELKEVRERQLETKEPEWFSEVYKYPYKSLRELHDFLVDASNELKYLELNGIEIDREYNKELAGIYLEKLANIEKQIDEILIKGGYQGINPRSPKQVKEALLHFRIRVESTNEETIKTIIERLLSMGREESAAYRFCEKLLEHRFEAKRYGTYVKGIAKRLYRGRVYTTFLVTGPVTGRLASRNPNIQNIVRDASIKRQFIPATVRPPLAPRVFVQADYAQAELRVLTWMAEEEYFRELLNDGTRDFFDELTPRLYPELPSKYETPEELWKEVRVRVKAFVYGLGYGRTEFSIAQEYKLPVEEAVKVKNRFFEVIPAVVDWQKKVKSEVWKGHDLISPFGRHRRFHLVTDENWKKIQNEALAFLPQSTSSDICLRAMVRVRRDLRGSGAFVRNIVHDSILVDCAPDMANDIATLLDRRMVESAQELVGDYVVFKTDTKIGKHWGEV